MRVLIMVLPVLVLAQLPDQPLAPWGLNHHATDVPKRHVEQIAAGRHAYSVQQGGTMDGTNCRSPVGVGMMVWRATWLVRATAPLDRVASASIATIDALPALAGMVRPRIIVIDRLPAGPPRGGAAAGMIVPTQRPSGGVRTA